MSFSELLGRIDEAEARVEACESSIRAFLPEDGRFDRLRREAHALRDRFPTPASRPPLFGLLAGVKDLFHVDGWPTRAGSRLPPEVLRGAEAECVRRLKAAGALIVGKTVTTEFAHFTPGPTRNPHHLEHTPGGSSSGSAAAVAAGFCDLALGTQTIGSIVRPAAFCGVVGLKPTWGRIPASGVIPLAPSLDHAGYLAADVRTASRAAPCLYSDWSAATRPHRPVLGIPIGPYLDQAPADTRAWFEDVCDAFSRAGYALRRVAALGDLDDVRERHGVILAAEAARVHAEWFGRHRSLYGTQLTALIERGGAVTAGQLRSALESQQGFRGSMRAQMIDAGIDAWICPSTPGPAPRGLDSTGDPVMNLPWTQAGLPAMNLPAGRLGAGLPMGLQLVGRWGEDEALLAYAEEAERVTGSL